MHQICVKMPLYEKPHQGSPSPVKYVKHCFEIREFVELPHEPEPPGNFPELKLAITVLSLVDYAKPVLKDTELAQNLTQVVHKFIEKVNNNLPEGVSIVQRLAEQVEAA